MNKIKNILTLIKLWILKLLGKTKVDNKIISTVKEIKEEVKTKTIKKKRGRPRKKQ